jgi:hypothetical protein
LKILNEFNGTKKEGNVLLSLYHLIHSIWSKMKNFFSSKSFLVLSWKGINHDQNSINQIKWYIIIYVDR